MTYVGHSATLGQDKKLWGLKSIYRRDRSSNPKPVAPQANHHLRPERNAFIHLLQTFFIQLNEK